MSGLIPRFQLEPLKTWLLNNKVYLLSTEQCNEFNDFVSNNYPWQGYIKDRIEWSEVENHVHFDWSTADQKQTREFIMSSCVSKYKFLAVVYSALEPGIVGDFEFIVNNLELINNHGRAGAFFVVGVSKDKYGLFKLHSEDFFELWSLKLLIRAPGYIAKSGI